MAGCIANVCFARLNEATVRVLQKNGCEVAVPDGQGCCGALHVHAGLREEARGWPAATSMRWRMAASMPSSPTPPAAAPPSKSTASCWKTIPQYAARARQFSARMSDVTEFLASIELNPAMKPLALTVTYQDSCHLAHGQRIRSAPRKLLAAVPGLTFREMPLSDLCCGSAGIYNVVQSEMSMQILEKKMENVNRTGADVIATANPGLHPATAGRRQLAWQRAARGACD